MRCKSENLTIGKNQFPQKCLTLVKCLTMFHLEPNYVTDNKNKKVAVQLNIKTFEKIEEILENYGLYHLMTDDAREEPLNLADAREYY